MTSPVTVAHYQNMERDALLEKLKLDKKELRHALRNAIAYINIEGTPSGRKAVDLLMDVLEVTE